MEGFKILQSLGKYVIVEPVEKSTVLKAEEISTVFRISNIRDVKEPEFELMEDDLIIVAQGTIEKTRMGQKEVCYVRESDIIARVGVVTPIQEK